MSRGRLLAGIAVVAAGASALTAGLVAGSGGAGQAQAGSEAVSRVERVLGRFGSSCFSDGCGIGVVRTPVTTPAGVARVDVTMTATFEYSTSRGDGGASADASIDDGTIPMRPRSFRLAPSGRTSTSITLTWIKRDLPAAGRRYRFGFSASPPVPKDGSSFVRGRRLVVVIEMWSAGA